MKPLPPEAHVADQLLDRDLRLDVCRGVALWFIFLDHVPDNICSWLTLRYYCFSDTTEVFMFVSGVTCALSYGAVQRQDGWWAVVSHTTRRAWEIYAAFLTLIVIIVVVVYRAGGDQLADETNVRILLQQPGAALAHAAILQYRPVNTDVLPTFVLYHLLFAPLLWLALTAPNATLAVSAVLYGLVQIYGWNLPPACAAWRYTLRRKLSRNLLGGSSALAGGPSAAVASRRWRRSASCRERCRHLVAGWMRNAIDMDRNWKPSAAKITVSGAA